jgi:hypothetical protein
MVARLVACGVAAAAALLGILPADASCPGNSCVCLNGCADSAGWHRVNKASRGCSWVGNQLDGGADAAKCTSATDWQGQDGTNAAAGCSCSCNACPAAEAAAAEAEAVAAAANAAPAPAPAVPAPAPAPRPQPLSASGSRHLCLLPVGDSITQGYLHMESWRAPLWRRLVDAYDGAASVRPRLGAFKRP